MEDLKAQLIEEFGEGNIVDAFGELTLAPSYSLAYLLQSSNQIGVVWV
jgi:hypothetical protein